MPEFPATSGKSSSFCSNINVYRLKLDVWPQILFTAHRHTVQIIHFMSLS